MASRSWVWLLFSPAVAPWPSLPPPLLRLVVDPPPRPAEDQHGEDEGDEEENPRHRRGIAHLPVAERVVVEVEHVEAARVGGSALGDDIGLGEDLQTEAQA